MKIPKRQKPNAKGRNDTEPYIRLHRGVTSSPAWQSLSCVARCLILLVWERHNGTNNGTISLSHREARTALGIGNVKTGQAFKEAQSCGFLVPRKAASFNWKTEAGKGRATEWEITTEACDGSPPKRLYKQWQENKPVPASGTKRFRHRGPLTENVTKKNPNGSDVGNRFAQIRTVSGS